jgi:hypothetical protein
MDESLATANETRYMNVRYPGKKLWEISIRNKRMAEFMHISEIPVQRIQELEWLIPARTNSEQTLNLPAPEYGYDNYGSLIYSKAAIGFNYLRTYLGDSLYDNIMHDYYRKWENKHPQPEDLRSIFESHTDKDLAWFFDDFLGTTKRLDYKTVRLKNNKLLIRNRGELNSPLLIAAMKGDTIISQRWEEGFKGQKWINSLPGNPSELRIDPDHKMPELYRLNDNIRTSGIFRKADPLKIQLIYTVEDPGNRYLIYFPSANWTRADGFMAGVALQNGSLIPKPMQYFVMPFYTFSNHRITGFGRISFNKIPYDNFIRLASLSLEGEQFGGPGGQLYRKARLGLDLYFRSLSATNPFKHKVYGYYYTASDLYQIESFTHASMRSYLQLGYLLNKTGIINPFSLAVSYESGDSYQKTSLELNYRYSYMGKKSGMDFRLFAGTMLTSGPRNSFYAFSPSGRSGREQYLYQGIYPDRFSEFPKTFFSRQMSLSEGGLATFINDSLGYSRWLCSFSLTSNLPWKASIVPVKPFINILLNDQGISSTNKSILFYEAGLKAGIWDFFEIYFPVLVSDNISTVRRSFKERIRFVFRLDIINPVKTNS